MMCVTTLWLNKDKTEITIEIASDINEIKPCNEHENIITMCSPLTINMLSNFQPEKQPQILLLFS